MDYEAMTEPEIDALKAAVRRSKRRQHWVVGTIAAVVVGGVAYFQGASEWASIGIAWVAGFVLALLSDHLR